MKNFTFSLFLLVLFNLNFLQAQDCNFKEAGGVIAVEAESATIPNGWIVSTQQGTTYIEWDKNPSFNDPGAGTVTYKLNVTTPGIYRLQIRNKVNEGSNTSTNNDSFLKLPNNENVVFFGHKGSSNVSTILADLQAKNANIVFPVGTGLGNPVFGPSKDGWLKVYGGGLTWNWNIFTNDEDPYDVYVKFNAAGVYEMNLSAREVHHAIDKIVLYQLPTHANDLSDALLDGFSESINNCPKTLPTVNNADGKCEFDEFNGVIAVETESNTIPANWGVSLVDGTSFIEWTDKESFNTPGVGTVTYTISVSTPGIYRFQWRSRVNKGSNTSANNDTWMKMPNNENIVFFGYQGDGDADKIDSDLQKKAKTIVFPKGTNLGNPANGAGGDGWFKVFSGGLSFNWSTSVNDENPYGVFVKFNQAGLYTIQLSGRSQYHAIDRMVLYHLKTHLPGGGNELAPSVLDGFAESGCVPKLPYTNNTQGDSLVLRLLHEKTSGASWNSPWDLSKPMGQWVGVKLDTGRRVVELSMVNRGMKGSLPSELAFLSKLKKFEITGNGQLSGRLPDLDKMVDLAYLDCSNNGGLGGSLAPIGNLTKLQVIKLANNQVSGGLPDNIGKLINLTTLDVSNNTLTGGIPAGIGSLNKLVTLNFANNALTGSVPALNALVALKILNLSGNDLAGEISGLGLGNLINLETLDLGGNALTGSIFSGVVNLVKLKKLNLGDNQLTDTIPPGIGSLVALTELNLSQNQLSGPIPASIAGLVNLTTALFNSNLLDGTVPSLAGLTKLTTLSLHNNSLSGLPNLSASVVNNLSVENNRLTFEDILPNLAKLSSYAPQDSVGEKKDVTLVAGEKLLIDLGIDDGVTSSIYQWNKDGVFFANTLKSELMIDNVGAQHLGVFTCVITNPQLPQLTLYSFPVGVKVNERPAFTSAPDTLATSDSTYTYNITVKDPNADDSVSIAATVLPAWLTFTDNGDGTAVLSGKPAVGDCNNNQVTLRAIDKGGLDTLQSFAIDITAKFSVAITSSAPAICKGDPVTFNATLTNPGPTPVYQWILNDQPLEGINAATITTSTLKTGDVLKLKVTTAPAPCLLNTEAEAVPVNVLVTEITSMAIVLNAEQSQVCAGEPATFTTILSNPGNNPAYQWYLNDSTVSGATGATYSTSALQDGDAVQVKVAAENPGCLLNTEAASQIKTVSVVNSMNLDVTLTADKTEAKAGDPVKFTATTAYTASPVAYHWIINGNPVAEESSPVFTSSTLKNNDKVKVKLTADSIPCLLNPEIESQEITMTIDAGIILSNIEKSTLEETDLSFMPADFTAAFTSGLGGLATIKITILPAHGTLQLNGTSVTVGQEIAIDKISGLVYVPDNEYSGADVFQWNGTEGTQFAISDANVNIEVGGVNDPPVFTLSRDSVIVKQGFESTEEITIIPAEVPPSEANQTITYSLDPSKITFANVTIDPNSGRVSITKIGGRIGNLVIAVVADDGQAENNTYAQTFLLEIRSSLNTSPLDIRLSSFYIPENQPAGSTVATINVIDNDPNDQHEIVFSHNDLYPDNAMFTIEGNALKNNEVLDFEGKNRMFLNLKATDRVGNSLTKQIVINITDENDPPSDIMISSLNIVEDLTIGGVAAEFSANDQDTKDSHTYTLVGEAKDNIRFLITGNKLIMNSAEVLNRGEEMQIHVRVDDENEGALEKDFTLTVISPEDEFANIKTGFTPGGDAWNPTWKIENIEKYPNARVEIFDSWGRRVFYSVGYQQEWDGTFEGEELPAGTYYYIIDTQSGDPAKGTITLMR